jgi:hypothetical protein
MIGDSRRRGGFAIVIVLASLLFLFIIVFATFYYSSGEMNNLAKTINKIRAQYIAEAGAAVASAQIFNDGFDKRFYKNEIEGPWGYVGHLAGDYGGGNYYVVCEDIANPMKDAKKEFTGLTYNRIDLFSRGTYRDVSVVVYKALIIHPEEKVYTWKTRTITDEGPDKGKTEFYDIQVR